MNQPVELRPFILAVPAVLILAVLGALLLEPPFKAFGAWLAKKVRS